MVRVILTTEVMESAKHYFVLLRLENQIATGLNFFKNNIF